MPGEVVSGRLPALPLKASRRRLWKEDSVYRHILLAMVFVGVESTAAECCKSYRDEEAMC